MFDKENQRFVRTILILLAILVIAVKNPLRDKLEVFALDAIGPSMEFCNGDLQYDHLASNVGLYRHNSLTEIAARLNSVSENRRAKDISVVKSNKINAYALFGGHIVLSSGIFQIIETDDELACIIGHETGHIEKRHILKRETRIVVSGLIHGRSRAEAMRIIGFSRESELEADALAMEYTAGAGYDPQACIDLMYKFDAIERRTGMKFTLTSKHPPTKIRIRNMKTWMARNGYIEGAI